LQSSAGGIDVDSAGAFDLLAAGAFSIDGTGASNLSTTSGNLTLSTITSGNLILSGAGDVDLTGATNVDIAATSGDITFLSGDDITFDDLQLSAPVQLTDTATGINAEYGTTGIIDAFNMLALFTAGNGADVVGVENGTLTNLDLANSSSARCLRSHRHAVWFGEHHVVLPA
jgi:hypothetical protein